jgi:outer membrane protein OmpU
MNNLKKVGLTALAGALVSVSANAADLSVTGGASIGCAGEVQQNTGNGWSMNDGITFGASAEMDNGWTVSTKMVFDSSDTAAGAGLDTRQMTIDMGDSGILTFTGDGGSGVLSAVDDVTPTAYEESWDAVTGADIKPSGPSGNNMFHYSNSTLIPVDGLTVKASLSPSGGQTEVESSVDYGAFYAHDSGLSVGVAAGEDNGAAASLDITNMYVKFASETGFTVGYQASESDSETADADKDFTAFGVSYAVSEDLSVSIGTSTIDFENSSLSDQDATGVSFSYTMGSMTLKGAHNTVDNVAGTAANDRSGYDLSLAFAF